MASDFDKAFRKTQSQQDVEARAQRTKDLDDERSQQIARSIAEPYLRDLGAQASQKLRELGVPLENGPERTVISRRTWATHSAGERHWILAPYHLYLTNDGYLNGTYAHAVSSREGFEAMMRSVKFTSAETSSSMIAVNDTSQAVVILIDIGSDSIHYEALPIAEWLAKRVLQLHTEAEQQRKVLQNYQEMMKQG